MTELERYKKALEVAKAAMKECAETIFVEGAKEFQQRALGEINAILNPPQEFENVEVVRWACYWPDGVLIATFDAEDLAVKAIANDGRAYVVKLTGTIKRPKVQKSASYSVVWEKTRGVVYPIATEGGTDIHAFDGKRGVLTFTWAE